MTRPRTYSALTREAARLLGERVRLARRERRWTVEELAERVGVAHVTITKVERGDLSVGLGTALEAAVITGVVLFDEDPGRRDVERRWVAGHLALLPRVVRPRPAPDSDF